MLRKSALRSLWWGGEERMVWVASLCLAGHSKVWWIPELTWEVADPRLCWNSPLKKSASAMGEDRLSYLCKGLQQHTTTCCCDIDTQIVRGRHMHSVIASALILSCHCLHGLSAFSFDKNIAGKKNIPFTNSWITESCYNCLKKKTASFYMLRVFLSDN